MWPFSRSGREQSREIAVYGEKRDGSIENPTVPVSAANFLAHFGLSEANLPAITIESALTVPAVWAAVSFLSRTLATLPLHAYKTTKEGPKRITGKLQAVFHDAPNPEQDSFKFRQYFWTQVFTGGRGLAWIERTPQGIEAIWPMDPRHTTIKRVNHRIVYQFNNGNGQLIEYPADDVIDVPFMLRSCGVRHYSPIAMAAKAIQLALAMNDYGSTFFAGGGVPPLALTGPLPQGPEAMKRAMADVHRAIDAARKSDKPVFPLPPGHELKSVGIDPEKSQMTDARRFQVEEVARAYQLPPTFLGDLTRATFTNIESQNLQLVQHNISQWAKAFEGELNLKVFGRGSNGRYLEHNLDGILRGDFASRMQGYAQSIQNGIRTPNEVRALENMPPREGGDNLYIQGATVPLNQAGTNKPTQTPPSDNTDDGADPA